MACLFECFQSHCHISKELHKVLHIMGAITIFGENIFIFSFVVMDWAGCTFEEDTEKTKCQKMNVNFLQPN